MAAREPVNVTLVVPLPDTWLARSAAGHRGRQEYGSISHGNCQADVVAGRQARIGDRNAADVRGMPDFSICCVEGTVIVIGPTVSMEMLAFAEPPTGSVTDRATVSAPLNVLGGASGQSVGGRERGIDLGQGAGDRDALRIVTGDAGTGHATGDRRRQRNITASGGQGQRDRVRRGK